jgi:hypothetical protein
MLRVSGAITADEYARERELWLAAPAPADHYYGNPSVPWFEGYAWAASSPAEAAEAISKVPAKKPLVAADVREPQVGEILGDVYRLAGRTDEAVDEYRQTARACAFTGVLSVMRARYLLGVTLEHLGDRPRACRAFRSVLARWRADGGSVSARESDRHFRTLRCDPEPQENL